jgi:hypothetical protein
MLFDVVKGNSMGDVDNFIRVLNRLTGSEEISMISVNLSYMYKYTLEASSLFDNIYIIYRQEISPIEIVQITVP